ncbi:MAG: hypothetical protein SH809_02160 [Rhodothermales bacterium]|nr:hypothetical protein [Rhodothermales bacterium]
MNRIRLFPAGALFGLLFLMGCYTSPVPIAPLDEAPRIGGLAGEWIGLRIGEDAPDEAPPVMTISTRDSIQFSIVVISINLEGEQETYRFQAYATQLAGDYFGNLKIITEGKDEYLIVRFAFSDDRTLRAELVTDDLMKDIPTTSAALRAFLLRNAGNSALYEDDVMYFARQE